MYKKAWCTCRLVVLLIKPIDGDGNGNVTKHKSNRFSLRLHGTGWIFDRLKIRAFRCSVHTESPFRTKIWTLSLSKFRVNRTKILNSPVWTKFPVKIFSAGGNKDVFGRHTSTGSEAFSLFICHDANLSNRPHFVWVYRRDNPRGMFACDLQVFRVFSQHSMWVITPLNP